MKRKVKLLLWAVAFVVSAGAWGFSATRPLQAELLPVKPREIVKKFVETGTVTPVWQRDYFSSSAGEVVLLNVREGDAVKAGQVLVKIDTSELEYRITQLQGQLTSIRGQERQAFTQPRKAQITQQQLAVEQAEKQLEGAREEYSRTEALFAAGAVSRSVLDEAGRAVTQLELIYARQVEALRLLQEDSGPPAGTSEQFAGLAKSLQAQIALLRYQAARAVLKAPQDSTVGSVHIRKGAVAGPGTPLLSLFRAGEYEAELFLLPEDVRRIKQGMRVSVSSGEENGAEPFSGTVARIAPTAAERRSALGLLEQRVKVTVSLSGDTGWLRPGYDLDVTFVTDQAEGVLAVPKTTVFNKDGERAVWVVRAGRAEIQPVQTGLETDDDAVIISGLEEGDLVISNPRLDELREGVRIVAP